MKPAPARVETRESLGRVQLDRPRGNRNIGKEEGGVMVVARQWRKVRDLWARARGILHLDDSPESIARGAAVGFFFGLSLAWGVQVFLAVGAAHLVRGNKAVAALLTAISNPLTSPALYSFCYVVGAVMMGGLPDVPALHTLTSLQDVTALGREVLLGLLVGTTVVGALGVAPTYLLVLQGVRRARATVREAPPVAPVVRSQLSPR
jgi:hypothetical protein